ncbi:MAG: DUF3887 domain-containing protein [Thermacetogeniaceae bacterium]|jgi:hypothetical protein|nr:DUF3887 domain-containing protein [Thermoanaerobacterales bacterium]NLN21830.1 DUF3887 domain-containing protein [Syntrophomonadaceae bacterium]HAF17858.1 DUF3887 domain-containing protein [Peptococcaceae bacterium]
MKKLKIKSVFILALSMIICFGLLTGCGQGLSNDFDEAEVKSTAQEVITMVNENDSEGLREMSTAQMKSALTDDVLNQMYEAIGEAGAFEQVEEMKVAGATENDTEYAVVVAKAKYEKRSFTYTISFNKDMKLAGFYYK